MSLPRTPAALPGSLLPHKNGPVQLEFARHDLPTRYIEKIKISISFLSLLTEYIRSDTNNLGMKCIHIMSYNSNHTLKKVGQVDYLSNLPFQMDKGFSSIMCLFCSLIARV